MTRIFKRLLLYFSLSMLIMSLILASLFSTFFTNYNKETYKKDLLTRAEGIAQSLAEMVDTRTRGMHGQPGLGSYLSILDEIAMTDVWVLGLGDQWVKRSHHRQEINYKDLPDQVEALMDEVLEGQTLVSESFSQVLDQAHVSVGVPIIKEGDIVGGVFLHGPVEGLEVVKNYQRRLLIVSSLLSFLISLPLAWFLSLRFTRPLELMQATALGMAQGDYSSKNHLVQDDEIGELAASMDLLSDRLAEISKIQEEEEERERAFLANISHELKTPVTVIRSSLEALRDGLVEDEEKIRLYYEQLLLESQQLEMLIEDLLELAKLRSSEIILNKEDLDMTQLIEDLLLSMGGLASKKDLELSFDSKVNYSLFGDYRRIRQMLTIVLDNALKFSPRGGQVRVVEELDETFYRLIIEDQGPGFSQEDLNFAFDRFHSSYFKSDQQGTGLGLAIAKELAEIQGFSIEIDSEPGRTRVNFIYRIL